MNTLRGYLLPAVGALLWLSGCASIGPPRPPSLELPRPPSDLRAARKGDKVTLTWSVPALTMDRQSVRYLGKTRICRSVDAPIAHCGEPVAEVAPPADFSGKNETKKKMTASYVGGFFSGLQPDPRQTNPFATVTYAVEVLNRDGRSAGLSNQVHVPLAETLPAPTDFAARLKAQGVVLTWSGPLLSLTGARPVRFRYRVFRRTESSQERTLVGEVAAGGASSLTLTDQSFEWEKTYYYHADSLTVLSQEGMPDVTIEGDDTPEVKIFAHDVFPPAVPTWLQAVFSGRAQQPFIDLIWAPVADADLDGYNVYRHEENGGTTKLNVELLKAPAYRDVHVASGKKYFYSVSAVDLRGNESAKSEEANESVP